MVRETDRTPEARAARLEAMRDIPTTDPQGKSITVVVTGAPGTGVFIVDRGTGRLGGSTFVRDIQEGGNVIRNIGIIPSEVGRYERRSGGEISTELVQKEVAGEAERIERGLPPTPLTQRGAEKAAVAAGLSRPGKQLYEVEYEGKKYISPDPEFQPKVYTEAMAEQERQRTLGEDIRLSLFGKQAGVRLRERKKPGKAVVTKEGFIVAPPGATIYKKEIPILRERRKRKELIEGYKYQQDKEVKEDVRGDIGKLSGDRGFLTSDMALFKSSKMVTSKITKAAKEFQEKSDIKLQETTEEYKWSGEYLRQQKELGKEKRFAQYGIGLGYLGFRGFKGAATPILHPIETAKGIYSLFSHPFKSIKEMAIGIKEDPLGYSMELLGGAVTLRAAGKIIKKTTPKVTYEKLTVPIKPKGKVSTKTVYRGIGYRYKTKGGALIGVSEGKVKIGTPKIDVKQIDFSKGFLVETPTQTRIMRESLKKIYKPRELKKFDISMDIMRATETTPSKYVQKKFIKETKTLSPSAVKEILKWSKEYKGEVYGSFAARQQMPQRLARTPADIDIQLPKSISIVKAEVLTKQLVSKLRKQGQQVRVSPTSPTLVEAKIGGRWIHGIDIHAFGETVSDIKSMSFADMKKVYGLQLQQQTIRMEGLNIMRLSEQAIRKGGHSILRMRERGFAPEPHRLKDIPDWFAAEQTLIESKIFGKKKLLGMLEEAKGFYSKDVLSIPTDTKLLISGVKPKGKIPPPPIFRPSPSIYTGVSIARSYPSIVVSPSMYKSISKSISKSLYSPSKRISKPPSYGVSVSPSVSKSISKSRSASRSASRSVSRSIFKSMGYSKSMSKSVSKRVSKSLPKSPPYSYYSYPKPGYKTPPPIYKIPTDDPLKLKEFKKKKKKEYVPAYRPSLVGVERYKRLGITITKPPKAVGLGERPVTREMIKDIKKSFGGMM